MKANVTNNSQANQGVYTDEGLEFLDPGETRSHVIAKDYVERAKSLPFLTVEDEDGASEPGPLDQSVELLTEYLAGVEDADEVQKLIDAETAGKSRKGALAALEARRDELLA